MDSGESRGSWLVSVGQYIAWLITALGAFVDVLYLREAMVAGLSLAGMDMTAYDGFTLVILGCLAVAAIVAIEYFFRKGRPKGLLLKRVGIVVGIEILIILGSIIFRQMI